MSTGARVVYSSSNTNQYYGTIGPITPLPLLQDLAGYNDLNSSVKYSPVPSDPFSVGISEGDIIYDTMNAIFTPVNMVLHKHSRGVRLGSFCEAYHSAPVTIQLSSGVTISGEHLSRVDRMWAFWNGHTWVKFAVVEFKRPGALADSEWGPAIQGGEVIGLGATMCRQGLKYYYSYEVRYIIVCDGSRMICLKVGGTKEDWFNSTPLAARPTPAQARWIASREEMKRYAFVFFREALEYKLRECGFL